MKKNHHDLTAKVVTRIWKLSELMETQYLAGLAGLALCLHHLCPRLRDRTDLTLRYELDYGALTLTADQEGLDALMDYLFAATRVKRPDPDALPPSGPEEGEEGEASENAEGPPAEVPPTKKPRKVKARATPKKETRTGTLLVSNVEGVLTPCAGPLPEHDLSPTGFWKSLWIRGYRTFFRWNANQWRPFLARAAGVPSGEGLLAWQALNNPDELTSIASTDAVGAQGKDDDGEPILVPAGKHFLLQFAATAATFYLCPVVETVVEDSWSLSHYVVVFPRPYDLPAFVAGWIRATEGRSMAPHPRWKTLPSGALAMSLEHAIVKTDTLYASLPGPGVAAWEAWEAFRNKSNKLVVVATKSLDAGLDAEPLLQVGNPLLQKAMVEASLACRPLSRVIGETMALQPEGLTLKSPSFLSSAAQIRRATEGLRGDDQEEPQPESAPEVPTESAQEASVEAAPESSPEPAQGPRESRFDLDGWIRDQLRFLLDRLAARKTGVQPGEFRYPQQRVDFYDARRNAATKLYCALKQTFGEPGVLRFGTETLLKQGMCPGPLGRAATETWRAAFRSEPVRAKQEMLGRLADAMSSGQYKRPLPRILPGQVP